MDAHAVLMALLYALRLNCALAKDIPPGALRQL
jgi:hypothetical protein